MNFRRMCEMKNERIMVFGWLLRLVLICKENQNQNNQTALGIVTK